MFSGIVNQGLRPIFKNASKELLKSRTQDCARFSDVTRPQKINKLPAAYYRGGTSRAIMFKQEDLPPGRKEWGRIFLGSIGSPDSNGRQLDGMGGGISSLSKVCVVGKSEHPSGADVDYTFVALGVKNEEVDFSSNCGNMTSAIGPFAIDSGLVDIEKAKRAGDHNVTVKIHNTNTGKIIDATFPVIDGETSYYGDFAIDGVEGNSARIELAFLDPSGSKTGQLLPTGNAIDVIEGTRASLVDCGNPCCFVSASDLDIDGTILPDQIEAHPDLLARLDKIRRQASVLMGLSKIPEEATGSVPKIAMVSTPVTQKVLSGEKMEAESIDVVVRAISVGQPHRAVPITVAMAIAAASKIEGSTVNILTTSRENVDPKGLTLGHPSGRIVVGSTFDESGSLTAAKVYRTARRLMDGYVYWR
ncbi:DUF453 domain protein [Bisporella sp. PMI_857]|nr:DUF453 domain protein [Bisporella sp. PMI_857]